jgi:hypothetical protein
MRLTAFSFVRTLRWSTHTSNVLFLDRAVVPCPVRGDIDLDQCLGCPDLRDLGGEPINRIECARRKPLPPV